VDQKRWVKISLSFCIGYIRNIQVQILVQ